MADVDYKKIDFLETMAADKRHPEACYLRKNLFASKTAGMYPAVDFRENNPVDSFPTGSTIVKHIDSLLFVQDGSDLKIYYSSADAPKGPYTLAHTFTGGSFYDAVDGNDDIHAMVRVGAPLKVYKINYNATSVVEIASQTGSMSGGRALFDGIHYFYFFADKIYRQLKSATMSLVFNDTGGLPKSVDFFGEQIILFFAEDRLIKIAFWDKTDLDLFDKVVIEKNARYLGGGNVDNTLVLLKSIGNRSNIKERNGEIVAATFDGEKFVRKNSIKAGDESLFLEKFAIGNEVMVVGINGNVNTHNTTLYNNWLLKIKKDGSIEVLDELELTGTGDLTFVDIHYDYISYGLRKASASPEFYHNADLFAGYASYINYTQAEYITNFLNDPANRHTLDGFMISFEKLFEDGADAEKLDLYYRVSEREDFVLMGEVTAEKVKDEVGNRMDQAVKDDEYNDQTKGLTHQIYEIINMPDESSLPEFNEIQFKFVSQNGFSIMAAWYAYSYILRNTR